MKEKFPVGSSYSELEFFLLKDGFSNLQTSESLNENRFYFRWRPIPWLGNFSNYGIAVAGQYDENSKIVRLVVN